ncbi:MAG: leucine-rich repeat protein [Metamycoplasmataceae bacterium]
MRQEKRNKTTPQTKVNHKLILFGSLWVIAISSIWGGTYAITNTIINAGTSTDSTLSTNQFLGASLTKENVVDLGWDTKAEITLEDWERDAPNVIEISPYDPDNVEGSYEDSAFSGNFNLVSIEIPAHIKRINHSTFYNAKNLVNVTFEEGSILERIGNYAFHLAGIEAEELKIEIPNTVNFIGTGAFSYSKIKKFTMPTNVTTLSKWLFQGAMFVDTINLTQNSQLRRIDSQVFWNSGITSLYIPDSVEYVDNHAFELARNLVDVAMPIPFRSTPPGTPKYGFSQAQWNRISWRIVSFKGEVLTNQTVEDLGWVNNDSITLTDWALLAPHVTTIDSEAFINHELTMIELPNRITTINDGAFRNTHKLHTVTISPSSELTTINDNAFENSGITTLDLPNSITHIGEDVFKDTTSLPGADIKMLITLRKNSSTPHYGFTQEQWNVIDWQVLKFNGEILTKSDVIDLGWSITDKITLDDWALLATNVTAIEDWAFEDLNLTSIEIPNKVTTIGDQVFKNNQLLTGANIEMLVQLRKNSTTPHYGLTQEQWDSINWRIIPFQGEILTAEEMINIGWTMKDSISLSDWDTYAYNVKEIDHFTFEDLNITSIEIPIKITSIGDYAFRNTTRLSIIKINPISELESIGHNAFESSAITTIEIPAKVTFIGENAFTNTNSLTSITLPYDLYVAMDPEIPNYGLSREQWDSITLNDIPNEGMICEIIAKELLRENNNAITWVKISTYDGIEEEAFKDTDISEITINYKEGFTIGKNAFAETDQLTNIKLSISYKPLVEELGFSQTQMNVIKYTSNDNPLVPGANNSTTGIIVGSVAGVLTFIAVGLAGFLYFKNKKMKKSLATAELMLEAQINTNTLKVDSEDK